MEKVAYTEDIISDYPASSEMYGTFQGLKDELCKMEAELDVMLNIIRELVESRDSSDQEDFEEALARARDFSENREFVSPSY